MNRKYNVTGSKRKEMVQIIGEAVGVKPVYMKVPTCAYTIGDITVSKEGDMIWDDRADNTIIRKVIEALTEAGYQPIGAADEPQSEDAQDAEPEVAEGTATAEPEEYTLTVSLPTTSHTGSTMKNLINLVYTRASLINKALGTSFAVEQGLIDTLAEKEDLHTTEDFQKVVVNYENEHGVALSGISITPAIITFSSLPETSNPDTIRAFTDLVAMMNKQALAQKRIQAKVVNEENEKYALRIWLTRLGMNGAEYKATRKILMERLSGHTAFRTEAEKQRWNERQAEKREMAKAAKLAEEVTAE